MNLSFNPSLVKQYSSSSQKIRVLSENWVLNNGYCPKCGINLSEYENNRPVADFYCGTCNLDYELKSKENKLGDKINDGAYSTMMEKITTKTNPSFFFLTYNKKDLVVHDLMIVPSYLFSEEIIEKRKPLSETAKRAGWTGCNILYEMLPQEAKIYYVQNGLVSSKSKVIDDWNKISFIKDSNVQQKGWILDIMQLINKLPKTFSLSDIYIFENYLKAKHPDNNNIKAKIRQQLQILRDKQFIKFTSRGMYETI